MSNNSVSRVALSVLALAAAQLACAPERTSNRTPIASAPIDETQLISLSGNTRPEARVAANDLGRVPDATPVNHVQLLLRRSPIAEHELELFIAAQQDRTSPDFHHWLTGPEYAARFGAADADVAAVSSWLTSHGMHVNTVSAGRTIIDFSGTTGQISEALHTEMHALSVKGVQHLANMSDPKIPAALAPVVNGIISLHDFRPHNNLKKKERPLFAIPDGSTTYQAMVPDDLKTIYNFGPLFSAGTSGQGTTIVVLEDTDIYTSEDVDTFRTKFGLTTYNGTFAQVHPLPAMGDNNCTPPGSDNGSESEAIIDVEWATAAAPSASIVLAACEDTVTFGGLIALENLLDDSASQPDTVSISYGECEAFNGATANAAFNEVFKQAATEGVSVFVSSGDEGAASCDADGTSAANGIAVSGYASTPYNVAVGGTDFGDTAAGLTRAYWKTTNSATFASAISYVPEIPWNDSCASSILSTYFHFTTPVGSSGFCNSFGGEANYLTTASGSGGPSNCATGEASLAGVATGTCRGWAKPSWQSLLGNPDDGVRDIPDVSLFAANGIFNHFYVYCDTLPDDGTPCGSDPSAWPGVGGTSLASPIMAGIQALVDQKWGKQGNPNPTYYKIAGSEWGASGNSGCDSSKGNAIGSTCTFNDVTRGDIDVNCTGPVSCYTPSGANGILSTDASGNGPAFSAHTGWDFATGIGTVNATNLVNNTAWNATPSQVVWTPPHH